MESTYDLARRGTTGRTLRAQVVSLMAVLTIVAAVFFLLQSPAHAQFNVCGIIQPIFASFLNSPFFAFIRPLLAGLLASFGCPISG